MATVGFKYCIQFEKKQIHQNFLNWIQSFVLQVAELTAELEKERSKVHSLKSEVDKFKVIRFCLSKKI